MPRHSADFVALAKRGAERRLRELQQEIVALVRQFPDLRSQPNPAKTPRQRSSASSGADVKPRRRRRMSAAARKAVSARMKKYWAARRKRKAPSKSA